MQHVKREKCIDSLFIPAEGRSRYSKFGAYDIAVYGLGIYLSAIGIRGFGK